MQYTIELTQEQERQLREEAVVRGEDTEHLLSRVVSNWLENAQSMPAEERERRERLRRTLAAARANALSTAGAGDEVEAEVLRVCDEVRTANYERNRRRG